MNALFEPLGDFFRVPNLTRTQAQVIGAYVINKF